MNRTMKAVLPAAVLALVGQAALAQGPGGGGFQMTPEMQAKMKAWQKFRENNKNLDNVQRTVRGFRRLDDDPKTQLNKDQAQKILAVVKAWRHKPVMKDEEARKVMVQLTQPLNVQQLKALARPAGGPGGRGGGGGFGGAGFGG